MIKILEKFCEWDRQRSRRKYRKAISKYSPEEQELILKGSAVMLAKETKEQFEKRTGWQTRFVSNNISLPKEYFAYEKEIGPFTPYQENVRYWLGLGRMGADVLVESCSVPSIGLANIVIGYPVEVINKKENIRAYQLGTTHALWGIPK